MYPMRTYFTYICPVTQMYPMRTYFTYICQVTQFYLVRTYFTYIWWVTLMFALRTYFTPKVNAEIRWISMLPNQKFHQFLSLNLHLTFLHHHQLWYTSEDMVSRDIYQLFRYRHISTTNFLNWIRNKMKKISLKQCFRISLFMYEKHSCAFH